MHMWMYNEYYYYDLNAGCTGAPALVLSDPIALRDWYGMLDMGGEL